MAMQCFVTAGRSAVKAACGTHTNHRPQEQAPTSYGRVHAMHAIKQGAWLGPALLSRRWSALQEHPGRTRHRAATGYYSAGATAVATTNGYEPHLAHSPPNVRV